MQTGDVAKDRQLHIRIGDEDSARLERLAAHHEMSAAQIVRMLIKREDEAVTAGDKSFRQVLNRAAFKAPAKKKST